MAELTNSEATAPRAPTAPHRAPGAVGSTAPRAPTLSRGAVAGLQDDISSVDRAPGLDGRIIEANIEIPDLIQAVTNRSRLDSTGLLSVDERSAVDRALAAIHRGEYTLQHFPSGWHLMPANTAPMEFI